MEGWRETTFGQLLSQPVRNGIYKPKQFHGSGVKIVNMGELFSYPRLTDVPMKRLELTESEKERFLLCNGDLIFARRSLTAEGAGKCSIVYAIVEETTFESSIICARPDFNKCCSVFLFYYFNSPYGKYLLSTILRQVAVAGITGKDLTDLEIKIPLLKEQQAIAAVLSCLDDKIDLLHRQNKTLEAMAQTLFRQWFVEEADEGWEELEIGSVVTILGGTTPSTKRQEYWNGEIHWTSPRDLSNNDSLFLFNTERRITLSGLKQIGSGLMPKGTVLMSSRAPIGYLAITNIEVAINQGYIAMICDKSISNYFMYLWCNQHMDEIKNAGNGSTFEEISKSNFKSLRFVMPQRNLLKQFDQIVSVKFKKILKNQVKIHTLSKLRDTLLPKLMSGEIRVEV